MRKLTEYSTGLILANVSLADLICEDRHFNWCVLLLILAHSKFTSFCSSLQSLTQLQAELVCVLALHNVETE